MEVDAKRRQKPLLTCHPMLGPSTSLFFQIAAGLIPILLAANGLSESLRPRRILQVFGPRGRPPAIVGIVLFTVAAVVAEFFAISEAVATHVAPSSFRLTFVADVIAIETAVLGVAFIWPWIQPRRRRTQQATAAVAMSAVLVGSTVGVWLLSNAVLDASNRFSGAAGFCVTKNDAENQRLTLDAYDRLAAYGTRQEALSRKANRLRRTRPIPRVALDETVKERDLVRFKIKLGQLYLAAVQRVGSLSGAESIEDILAQLGC